MQPSAKDWSALLRAHAKQGDLEGAGTVCGAMAAAGVPADGAAYAALAHVYMLHSDAAAIVRPAPGLGLGKTGHCLLSTPCVQALHFVDEACEGMCR